MKRNEYFCFSYQEGQEVSVLDALVEMVRKHGTSFDWLDAAILAHQLNRKLSCEIRDKILREQLKAQ